MKRYKPARKQSGSRRKGNKEKTPPDKGFGLIPPLICKLNTIAIPTNRSGNRIIAVNDPEIENAIHIGEDFTMRATFEENPNRDYLCSRCVYRQYVRGEFRVNGRRRRHRLGPNGYMSRSRFKEDIFQKTPGSRLFRYGHREDQNDINIDEYLDIRATGCKYKGSDRPGLTTAARGIRFKIDLHFKGQIKHALTGKIISERRWRVYYAGISEDP